MGNSKSAVIFWDTLQQLLHRLGADEELLLVVCMNDCYLHWIYWLESYKKHLADAKEWVAEEKREDYARAKTRKDIYDAMQSLEYEINTLFTSNGQTPFRCV